MREERPLTWRWLLDVVALAGPKQREPAALRGADAPAGQDPAAEVARLRRRGLTADATVIDLGARTGTVALAVASACRQVIAVKVAALMLAALAQRAHAQGITTVQAGFMTYAYQGAARRCGCHRHVLRHLPDPGKAVARITAQQRRSGLLSLRDLIFSCVPDELAHVIDAWLAGTATDRPRAGCGRCWRPNLRPEHGALSWLLAAMLDEVGVDLVAVEHTPARVYSSSRAIKRAVSEGAGERAD